MSLLFSPFALGQLELPNRIVIPPMCQYQAKDGLATAWHTMHYGQLALSGAGLLILEATAVAPEGRISPYDLGLWSDETANSFKPMLEAIRQYSTMPLAVQLGHAGRKASQASPWEGERFVPPAEGGWETVGPSAVGYTQQIPAPKALDLAGIERIKTSFANAAVRADKLGFDCIELHAAHGYLLHEFLSPLSNVRTDNYGGSLANRMRLVLEVFDLVRANFSASKPVGIRISASDWVSGGWNLEESIILSQELKNRGCAFIHVSSGGLVPEQKITISPGYQVSLAKAIKTQVQLPTIAVGLITEATQAETILQTEQADLIAVGRGMLYDPRWPWHAAAELNAQICTCPSYWRSTPRLVKNLFMKTE